MAKILQFTPEKVERRLQISLADTVPDLNVAAKLGMILMAYATMQVEVVEACEYNEETQIANFQFYEMPNTVYILTCNDIPVTLAPAPPFNNPPKSL